MMQNCTSLACCNRTTQTYWSGNNNQIYKTLVQLHADGLVESEVQQQENYPTRKEYRLTDCY